MMKEKIIYIKPPPNEVSSLFKKIIFSEFLLINTGPSATVLTPRTNSDPSQGTIGCTGPY